MANTLSFDEAFYLSRNPDVAAAVSRGIFTSGAQHYELNGRFEARNPNAFFDTAFYLGQYPDVARAGINPLTHFLTFGVLENRATNATELFSIDKDGNGLLNEFDAARYLLNNQDVANGIASGTIKSAYQHFIQFGQFEGRVAPLTNGTTISGPFTNTGVPVNTGITVALTTGVDNAVGTVNNDTFVGEVSFTDAAANATVASGTLSVNDVISGGAGTDTLSVTVTGGGATYTTGALPTASINNVENLNIRAVQAEAADIVTVSAAIPGLASVNSDRSTSAVSFTNVASGTTVGVIGNGVVANGATSADFVAGATSATVNVSGGTTGGLVTLTGTGLTSTTINSTGVANTLGGLTLAATTTTATINAASNLTTGALTAAGLTTLNVNGSAANVNVGTLTAAVTTVDASGLTTGGLTATLDAAITSFKGGQGSDVITTTAVTSTTAGIINAGAGTDTLVVGATTDVNTAAKGALYTGFETLRVGGSQDVSLVSGITALEINAATSAAISNISAAQAGNITVRGDQTTGLTLTLANATGSSDAVTLKLQNPTETASARADVDVAGLSVIGVETLNVQALSGGTSLATAGELDSLAFASGGTDKLTTINLSGDRSLDLSFANVTNAVTVNNSMTGSAALLVSAGATIGGSVVNGTANADDVTLGTVTGSGNVTYNLGAGNDAIRSTAANLANHAIDAGAGTDTLSVTNTTDAATLTDATFQRITNVEKFAFANTTGDVSVTSGGFFNTNFASGVEVTAGALTTGAATINLSAFNGNATINTGTATSTGAQTITTGAGNDVVTVNGTGTGADFVISTGAGNDIITVNGSATTDTATVTGGLGKDVITFASAIVNTTAAAQITVNIGAGESTKVAYDSVTGFDLGTATLFSSALDFDGTSTVAGNFAGSAVAGYTSAELTATNTSGIITFQGSAAAGLTLAQRIEAVDSLINTDNATAAFTFGGNTYVFHDSATANGDSLVELVGVTATSLITTNAAGAGGLYIA